MTRRDAVAIPAIVILLVLASTRLPGATFTATSSGTWNNTGTWGGAGTPGAGDLAVIPAGIAVTVPTGFAASADSVVVRGALSFAGASAELTAGSILNAGSIGMGSGGGLQIGRSLIASGGTFTPGTTGGSTVEFNGTAPQQIPGYQFYNLTVSNSGAPVTTEGNVSVRGNLSVREGAVLSPRPTDKILPLGLGNTLTGSGTVQVTHTGTVSSPTKSNGHFGEQYQLSYDSLANLTVEYAGTAPQIVTSLVQYYPIVYGGLKINNAAGVTLAGDIIVAEQLTLASGSVNTGSFFVAIGTQGRVVRAGGWVAGALERWVPAGDMTVVFDIGSAGAYAPLEVAFKGVTSPGSVRASTAGSAHPSISTSPLIATKSIRRYWNVLKGGLTFAECDMTFTFQASEVPAGADVLKFRAARYAGGAWSLAGEGVTTGTSVQVTGATAFGDFTAGEVIPSPPPPPMLSSPDSGSLVSSATPTLSWEASPGASSYTVELAANRDIAPVLSRREGITETSAAVSSPLVPGSTVFWRVTAVNDGGPGASGVWDFGVAPPPSRESGSPADGATEVSTTPTFRWSPAPNASGYRLQVSTDAGFSTLIINQTLTGASYSIPRTARLASGIRYYWRCSATYPIGESSYSEAWSFTTLSGPTVLYVNGEWAGHQARDSVDGHLFGVDAFAGIQEAVNAAPEETSVQISPGTYAENVTVNRRLFITGESGVIVDGGGTGACMTLRAEGMSIEGVCLQHGTEGVVAEAGGLVLKGCRVEKNRQSGVKLSASDYAVIHGNVISDNGADGVLISGSKHVTVIGNRLSGNGIHIRVSRQEARSSLGAVIEGNTFRSALEWNVLLESDAATAAVRFNVFGPEGIDKYIRNLADGTVNARDNWFGGKNPPVPGDFQGEVEHSALQGESVTIAVFPADHAVPMDGRVTLPVLALVPPGRSVRGTSVTLGWDAQKLVLQEGIERGYFFRDRADPGTQEWFTWQPEIPTDRVRFDQALLGAEAGAGNSPDEVPYVGTLFAVNLKATAGGTDRPALSGAIARDLQNQPLEPLVVRAEGCIIIDVTPPVVESVVIDNTSLETDRNGDGRDDFIKNGQNTVVSATVTDEGGLLAADITANLNPLHGGSEHAFLYPGSYDETTHQAVWGVEGAACQPSEGQLGIVVRATDRAGNTAAGSAEIIADNTPPAKITGFTASPGHGKVKLNWTNGSDNNAVKGTVVRFTRWNDYPAFAEGSAPAYPATPSSGDGEAGNVGFPGMSLTHECSGRDVYHYTAFAYDWAGNFSGADAEARDRSTNYYLGDLGSGSGIEIPGTGGYDGMVNYMDLWWFSSLYYTEGNWAYGTAREADIGPSSGSKLYSANDRFGIPAPDGRVDFEDLMIFAMNYANTAPKVAPPGRAQPPGKQATGKPAIRLGGVTQMVHPGEEFDAVLYLANDGRPVKGCSVVLRFNRITLDVRHVMPGEILGVPDQGLLFKRVGTGKIEIDAAVLGTGRCLEYSGEIAVIRFQAKEEGPAGVEISRVTVRDQRNRDREFAVEESVEEIPTEFLLSQNYPNPFNAVTIVAYDVPTPAPVTIDIYNIIGEEIIRLVESIHAPGRYRAVWNGVGMHGDQCASGVYFCLMRAADYRCVRKLLLTR